MAIPHRRSDRRRGGTTGEATSAGCSFRLVLADQEIERRNSSSDAATADRPAFTHEDLMYIHPDGDGRRATFEVAPPGRDFATYVTGRLDRSLGTRSG